MRLSSVLIVLVTVSCGGRPLHQSPGDGAPLASPDGSANYLATGPCVVSIRLDVCCPHPEPVRAGLLEDPCRVRWPSDVETPQECKDRWPQDCALVGCGPPAVPHSRLAKQGGEGQCYFVDECKTDADCVIAQNHRLCCDCASAWPKELLGQDPCLTSSTAGPPPLPVGCTKQCTNLPQCKCADPYQLIGVCMESGGPKLCQAQHYGK